jgi:rhodanese-related sulfurtransferase
VGLLRRLGIGLSMLAAQVGLAESPEDDAARIAKVQQMYQGYRADFEGVPEVQPSELEALLKAGDVVLVDTRTPEERAVSRLPGAIDAEAFDATAAKGKVIVAYCTIGYRSGEWAEARRAEGLDARNLAGSVLAWSHHGGALVTPDGEPTKRLHVYGALWDLARTDYTAVY